MLSDVLLQSLPELVATTYPYVTERRHFDYGELGDRVMKLLAELIAVAQEIDQASFYQEAGEEIRATPNFQALSEGNYKAVIDAYLPKCEKQMAQFKPVFDREMRARAALSQSGIVWITPEVFTRPDSGVPQIQGLQRHRNET